MKYAKEIQSYEEACEEIGSVMSRRHDLQEQIRSLQSQLKRLDGRLPSLLARAEELSS